MLERWLLLCRVITAFTLLLTNLFSFHRNKFDEMPCKLDSTENLRPFEKYPTPPASQGNTGLQNPVTLKNKWD